MQSAPLLKKLWAVSAILFATFSPLYSVAQQVPMSPITDPSADTGQSRQSVSGQTSGSRGITLNDPTGSVNGQDCLSQQQQPNCIPSQTNPSTDANGAPRVLPGVNRQSTSSQQTYPPTEFQRMVRDTLGRPLPIYGANLFENAPSTFAPVDRVPVTPEYVIGPGDELLIQAWGQVTLNGHYTVDRTGNIALPQLGPIHVAGLPFARVQEFVKSQMSRVFRNFDLNVNMGQLRSIQIFVVGQARRPGSYTVSSLSTLVNALFVTGGPTPQGSMRHIQLKRSDKTVVEFDLYDLLLRGDKSKDVQLLPGDVVYIPSVGSQVAMAGSVNTPAIYELNAGATIGNAVELAGGLTSVAMTKQLRIERVSNRTTRSVTEFEWNDAGRSTVLQDGDIVEFPTISDRFQNAVTLRGNVANPGRYTWRPGMRVRDLIPNSDSLVTRDYWQQRAKLGESTLNYVPLPNPQGRRQQRVQSQPGVSEQINPDGSTTQFYADEAQQADAARNLAVADSSRQPLNATGVTSPNITTTTTQQRDQSSPPPDPATSSGTNASTGSAEAGVTSTLFSPKTYVMASGPDINWAYAVIDRQDHKDLTTSLISFNLGAVVLNGDESQNYELLPDDVVTIFSKADIRVPQSQQTRYVRLEGEFGSAGIYTVRTGETLRQLVARAGGLTSDAYLYGSDFTRESTRRAQQQRLNAYASQLEQQASSAVLQASSRATSQQDGTAAAASQQQAQLLVARLRQLQASGRIVLDLPVDSRGVDALPDLPLEDGDRFLVPRVPSTVAVEGAVYNANAFLYAPGRRVGKYVKMAGGSNRDADKSREFVVRADGSVVSRQYSSRLRGDNFDSVRLYPGDAIVVPQNLTKGAALRTIVDIATIVGQFGLAAAAINLVK